MKATVRAKKEIEIKTVVIDIHPRYIGDGSDDDIPADFPLLNGGNWIARVDIDTGVIEGWPHGEARQMHVKVCDEGTYRLLDADGNEVAAIRNDYVPNELVPGSYGDYIEMDIDATGKIVNWPESPDVSEFFGDAE